MNLRTYVLALSILALTACETTGSGYSSRDNGRYGDGYYGSSRSSDNSRDARCADCGVVTRIDRNSGSGSSSGGGAVIGAVVGGVLGNQVGSGSGRTAATVAGAVAGGVAGNSIERRNDRSNYAVTVRMDRGGELRLSQNDLNGIREGDRVRVRNGRIWLD